MNALSLASAFSRNIPTNRIPFNNIKWYFLLNSTRLFKNPDTGFVFTTNYPKLKWSAAAYPEVLTRHLMFEGHYQLDVLTFLSEYLKPGDTYMDVGGHHGLMALTGAKAVGNSGKVITFEPNPYAREIIKQHLKLNNISNTIIESIGLSNEAGEIAFYVQKGEVTWNSTIIADFVDVNDTEKIEKITININTLDNYILENNLNPKAIKIDVEGAEFLILEGAKETLKKIRPVISMEFNPVSAKAAKSLVTDYSDFMTEQNYELKVLKKNLFGYFSIKHHEPFNPEQHCSEDRLSNVLCIPREKMNEFS